MGNPFRFIDPFGLESWMLHLHDHGAPHIQLGDSRWDAKTLRPIQHKGRTPAPLTAKQLETLRQSHIWDRLMKNVPDTQIERVARELLEKEIFDEMQKKGARCLTKKAAKEIVEQVLRKTPLVVFFVIAASDEVKADMQDKGVVYAVGNQVVPISLVNELIASGQDSYNTYVHEGAVRIRQKTFINAGYSEEEALQLALELFECECH